MVLNKTILCGRVSGEVQISLFPRFGAPLGRNERWFAGKSWCGTNRYLEGMHLQQTDYVRGVFIFRIHVFFVERNRKMLTIYGKQHETADYEGFIKARIYPGKPSQPNQKLLTIYGKD